MAFLEGRLPQPGPRSEMPLPIPLPLARTRTWLRYPFPPRPFPSIPLLIFSLARSRAWLGYPPGQHEPRTGGHSCFENCVQKHFFSHDVPTLRSPKINRFEIICIYLIIPMEMGFTILISWHQKCWHQKYLLGCTWLFHSLFIALGNI